MLVPLSKTYHRRMGAAGTVYAVLGPFPEGSIVERARVFVRSTGTNVVSFGASLGRSGEASEEAFASGIPLVTISVQTLIGRPVVRFAQATGESIWFDVECGLTVQAGSGWIVLLLNQASATDVSDWVVALRVRREDDRRRPEPGAS